MPTFRAPAILFLKATTTTTITVPGYYRKDGTFVPPHQKLVHINPDKSKADVLSGKGSHSQKVAHSKLSKLPGWASMTEDEQHAHILSWATSYQQKQSAAAAVSGWKASMLAGKKPTAAQQAAFVALPKDKQLALGAEVGLPASMVEVMGAKPAEQQPKDAPLHVFTNPDAGLESKVILGSSGKYHVVLKDTDSGEHVPTVNIHDTEAAAVADAKKAAGVKTDAEPAAAAPETVTVEPQSGKTGPTTFPLPPAEFESYAAAQAWAASRAKAAGMQKKQFEASHEYAHAFPAIMAAYEHDMMGWAKEKAAHAAAMQQGMADAGVKAGDTVAWTHVGSFLNATQHSGVVKLSSDGVPYVHLGYEVPVAKKGGKIGYVKKLAWQPYMLPAGAAASGPKDGDTKAGANGQQLVFKDGRWHKVVAADEHGEVPPALVPVEDEAAGPDLSTVSSWSALKKQKEDDPTKVLQMAEAWLAANPTKADDLSSTLVDLGFLGVAKVMGIYKPPSAGLKSPTLADHAKADAENEAAAAKIDELVSGTGGHYPVKAAKAITAKLKDDPEFLASWSEITHVQRLQIIVDLAKEYQAAASASAAVSGWKKTAHAGKNPTPAQWKAFYALPAGKKAEMLSAVHAAAGGTEHLKAPAVAKDEPAPAPASQAAATPVTLSPSQEAAIVDALKLNGGEMPGAGTGVGYYASIWDSLSPEKQADLKAKAKGGAPANTAGSGKVVVGGKMYVKDGDVWSSVATGTAFQPGSFRHAALSVINGDPVSPAVTGKAKAMALSWMFDQSNHEHGVSPQKALNALFPPADGGPEEGDTKEVNGTTYVLKNGRWHKLGEELDGGAAPDSVIEKNAASLQGTQYELKDGAWIDANGSAAPPMYALALNLIAGKEIDQEVAAKNSGMMSNGKLFAAKMAVAEGVSPVVALNALFPRSGENAPKDGNKKTIGDVDYVMKDGVWHDPKDIDESWLPPDLKSALDYFFDEKDEYNLQWAVDNGTPAQASYAKQKLAELHGAKLDTLHGTENNFGDIPESGAGGDVEWDVFSNTEPGHNKFWAVSVNGDQMITHYGKIGSAGTTTVKKFASNGEALAAASKLQKQKQAKGYTFTGTDFYPVPDGAKAAPKPAAEVIKPKPALEPADGWPQTGPQGGSNPGGRFKDPSGQEWYIKLPASEAHAKNELLAAKLYEAAGIKVPELKLVTMNGKVRIASKWVGGMSKTKHPDELAMADGALSGFAVDAWLANWDVTGLGLDNLLVGPDGKAVRIDVGGSLLFRAQGSPKGGAFGNEVVELQSLVDPKMNPLSAALFGGMSKAAQEKSAERVLKVSDEQIAALVDQFGPGSAAERAALAQKLIARKAAIAAAFPSAKGAEKPKAAEPAKPKLDPTALPVNPNDLPPYHDFHNWNGPGKGLSSKAHINDANLKAEKDLHDFALKGNLVALKDYHFEAIDKETGASLGMKPISEHPSQHVKLYHSDLLQYLDAIANPPEPLRVTEGNDPAQFKAEKLGKTISTVQANKKLGFWVALGKLSKAEPFVKYFVGKEKPVSSAYKTQAKAKGIDHLPKLARRFINRVQSSGSYNDYFRDGNDSDHEGYSTAAIASAAYSAASPKPAGTTIYRWQNMPESMVKQLLAAEPGLVFQNPGSMCCSMSPTGTSGFGQHRMVIHYAEGAMAVDSFASGSFTGEQEITTLMGQRFMLLRSEMSNNLGGIGKKGLEIHVLMLPPDPDYVADLQQRAATTTLKKSHRVFNELMGIEA